MKTQKRKSVKKVIKGLKKGGLNYMQVKLRL